MELSLHILQMPWKTFSIFGYFSFFLHFLSSVNIDKKYQKTDSD